jgi:hypothetical protein
VRSLLALVLLASPAFAGRHTVHAGETLEYVARIYGCETDQVLRANGLNTTLVRPGTVVTIPDCTVRSRARTRRRAPADDRAARALAVIDGTAVVTSARAADVDRDEPTDSVGRPWNGRLINGEALPQREGYRVRRPQRAYGAPHVIAHLQTAIASVRALYDVHTLAIGDLSAQGGGKIGDHHSHQSGLDVDVGFYFKHVPDGYPASFARASDDLDLAATWALLVAFVRTMDRDDGVEVIFLDYDVQARLYRYAKQRGTPDADLAAIFQYPRGKDALVGLVHHWPHHADHFHVRFRDPR